MAALAATGPRRRAFELAGPETLSYDEIVRVALRSGGRHRRLLHVPLPVVRGLAAGAAAGSRAPRRSPPGRRRS